MHALARHVTDAVEQFDHIGDLVRITVQLRITSGRPRSRFHTQQCRRGHLAAGHPINRIVDEDDRNILSAVAGMHRLARTNRGQVTVTLVGKDQFVGTQTLHRRSYGCGTAVRRLGPVDIDIIIGEHRAADRRHPDRIVFEIQFFEHFGDQLVHDPMAASRTIVHRIV